jgi:hypothetical protein
MTSLLMPFAALAAISGESLVHTVVWIVVVALICWLLWWLIGYAGIPEPFNRILRVIVAVFAVLFLINLLLGLAGHPIIRW